MPGKSDPITPTEEVPIENRSAQASPMSTSHPVPIDAVNRQIRRLSSRRFHWLTFSRELEDRFEAETAEQRCARLWLEGLLAIVLFDLFLIADYYSDPGSFRRAFVVRMLIITPLSVLVNVSML